MGALSKTLFNPQPADFWPQDMPPFNQIGQSGTRVTPDNAFGLPAFLAGVRVQAEDLAKLPFKVYRRLHPRGKEEARDHPVYRLLHDAPNPEMTSFIWRETSQAHVVTWGGLFSEKVLNRKGELVELWPLRPDRVQVKRDTNTDRKFYRVRVSDGESVDLTPDEVFHVPGLGFDGHVGYSVITMMAKAIGLGMAAQQFAANFWDNNARPGGYLQVPAAVIMSDPAAEKLRGQYEAKHAGLTNAQRIAILRDGITFNEVGIPPEDAQFLQTRQFQVTEIARAMRLPPHKIGDLSRSTFSNIEQQALEYVQDSLGVWAKRWEQQVNKDLLGGDPDYFAEFNFDALLRGDSLARAQSLWIQLQAGAINQDEWRDIENRNPLPNHEGENYLRPANLTPLAVPDATPEVIAPASAPPVQTDPGAATS